MLRELEQLFYQLWLNRPDFKVGCEISGDFRLEKMISYVSEALQTTSHKPWRLAALIVMLIVASSVLILLVWMVVTPFSCGVMEQSLMPNFSKQWEWDLQDAHMRKSHVRMRTIEKTEILQGSQDTWHKNQVLRMLPPCSACIKTSRTTTMFD